MMLKNMTNRTQPFKFHPVFSFISKMMMCFYSSFTTTTSRAIFWFYYLPASYGVANGNPSQSSFPVPPIRLSRMSSLSQNNTFLFSVIPHPLNLSLKILRNSHVNFSVLNSILLTFFSGLIIIPVSILNSFDYAFLTLRHWLGVAEVKFR